jgi:hypothetical protein
MRRISALVLLSVMAFWLSTPLLASSTQDDLPACCRANGKHKCMMMRSGAGAEAGAPSIAEKCPFLPYIAIRAIHGPVAAAAHTGLSPFAFLTDQPVAQPQEEVLLRISFARTRQKRGPPAFLFIS